MKPRAAATTVCPNLRWKGHRQGQSARDAAMAFAVNRTQYACLRTCLPWGLDDAPAAPELCQPGRVCFGGRE